MARVGICRDCEARYKIPDTVQARRARCKKCEGVVEIPPLEEAQPEESSPPQRSAPAKKTPARQAKEKPPVKSRKNKGAPTRDKPSLQVKAKKTPRKPDPKRKGSGRRGGRSKRGEKSEGKNPAVLYSIIGGVVLLIGAGLFFAFSGSDSGSDPANAVTTPEEVDPTNGQAPTPVDETAAAAPAPTAEAASAPAAAPEAPPPAVAVVPTSTPGEPKNPVLDFFDPLPPVEGTDLAQLEEWTVLVSDTFFDPPHPKTRRKLIAELDAIDIVDLTPAIINTMAGKDMSDQLSVRDAFGLVDWWQERCARKPHFFFEGDITRMSPEDIDKRVIVMEGVVKWWQSKLDTPGSIATYRDTVAVALAAVAAEGG